MSTPRRRPPRWLIGIAAAGATVGAVVAAQHLAVRRWAKRPDVFDPAEFASPGAEHRLRSHDGGTVFACEAGSGPTVVLGHGIAGDNTHWAPVAHRLVERGFRVVTFDQRGHGRSVAGSDGFGLLGLAHDAATVIAEFADRGPVLIGGHSMGGVGVQALARHHPEVLDRVGAVAIVASLPHTIGGPLASVLSKPWVLVAYRHLMSDRTRARVAMRAGFGDRFTVAMLDELSRTWAGTPDETLIGFGTALGSFDLLPDLANLRVPALVICGTHDSVTPMRLSERIASALPDAHLVPVGGAGHMIVWEAADRLATEIADFARTAMPRTAG